jgi:GT2 family glycosyltransferase
LLLLNFIRHLGNRLFKHNLKLSNLKNFSHHHTINSLSTESLPRVSILIPTRDKPEILRACINSIMEKTMHSNLEVIIIDNDSVQEDTKSLLFRLENYGIRILKFSGGFNYSSMCNFAARQATGEFLCFLNNDTEAIEPEWLQSMVEHASQPEIGIVGSVLLYPDGSLQHMGVALGHNFIAGHPYRGKSPKAFTPQECFQVSAVTFACAVISKTKFESLGGLDENLPSGFNDVDISLRAENSDLKNILCVRSVLTHHESQTRVKTRSVRGIGRAFVDAIIFLNKHPNRSRDNFFTR